MIWAVDDGDVRIAQGDALDQLRLMDSGSVQCVVTSPPFWGLRDYGTAMWIGGDPACSHRKAPALPAQHRGSSTLQAGFANQNAAKDVRDIFRGVCGICGATSIDGQIGLERSPDGWCAALVDVFREARRVLRDDGVMWLEVGDTYSAEFHAPDLKPKDLVGAPWALANALRADGWYLRADVIWSRPDPMPESVTDRPTKSHSYVFLLSKGPTYFYDALREPAVDGKADRRGRTIWTIATEATPFAHFATMAQAVAERCIASATSEHGACVNCGTPWTRVTERGDADHQASAAGAAQRVAAGAGVLSGGTQQSTLRNASRTWTRTSVGWQPGCGCRERDYPGDEGAPLPVRPCVVLDPFMGSGTTALVARRMGRHAVGVELAPAYIDIAQKRLQQLSLFGAL